MPRLTDENLEQFQTTGAYGFSGAKIDDLGATEYTLVGLTVDNSGSVGSFAREIEACIKKIIQSCLKSPRADNLMIRTTAFGSSVEETHGFKLLGTINVDDYDNMLDCSGLTALFDGTQNIVESVSEYGRNLMENDFSVNGIVFVITDGFNNNSTATINMVKEAFKKAVKEETLESLVSVLIGVGADDHLDQELEKFKNEVGFTQYISMGDASPDNLAKLAEFVSKSISSQSQARGSGGPSSAIVSGSLTF